MLNLLIRLWITCSQTRRLARTFTTQKRAIIWESWLEDFTDGKMKRSFTGRTTEAQSASRLCALMQAAFHKMFRVLKPGRWATVEFNNSDGAVFEAIKEAVRKAGFEIANMLLLDKQQKTFKQVKGAEGVEDVVDKDVLFNLHKPAVVRTEVRAEDHDLEQQSRRRGAPASPDLAGAHQGRPCQIQRRAPHHRHD